MGGRLLRSWIERPLSDADEINARLDAVECFTRRLFEANALREALSGVYDVERLLSRIAYDALNARDCLALRATLQLVPLIKKDAAACEAKLIQRCESALDPMEDICSLLSRAIDDEAPLSVREGGMIRAGYSGNWMNCAISPTMARPTSRKWNSASGKPRASRT